MKIDEWCRSIESEFAVALGNPERVASACAALRSRMDGGSDPAELLPLVPLLSRRQGPMARPLFDLVAAAADRAADPRSFLEGMIAARDPELALRGLEEAARRADEGWLTVDRSLALQLSSRIEAEGSPLAEPAPLRNVARILRRLIRPGAEHGLEPTVDLYLNDRSLTLRRLAARLLDLDHLPPPPKRAERMLGGEAYRFLAPYLAYTRATHRDLLDVAAVGAVSGGMAASLREAEARCGEKLLREVISELGWSRLNLGMAVEERIALSVDGSYPLLVTPAEAELLEIYRGTVRIARRYLIVAHGGRPPDREAAASSEEPIRRFRMYNLAHAEVLAEILSAEPLRRARAERLLQKMDGIVGDFVALFHEYDDEAKALEHHYASLRGRIRTELDRERDDRPLSAEVTRLVQMFEDPRSLAEVRTLHGLKRYLHQRGLHLGFRLVEAGRSTNRNVDLLVATPDRVHALARRIDYVDFEPADAAHGERADAPYPVRVVADAFGRCLLHEVTRLPDVKVFCYGNEVHYYIAYGSHPAFLRIDFSPPLRGGMIDLEYYGVSKNELELHPAPDLGALRRFFRSFDFDCEVARTRVHARYDKERAADLGELCEKVELLFRMVPCLMDLDWVIGSLSLDEDARARVADAWADFLRSWGVLPFDAFLTGDRRGILVSIESDPAGEREIAWAGAGAYRDRYTSAPAQAFFERIEASLQERGLARIIPPLGGRARLAQLTLERALLRPLRDALARGEIQERPHGLAPTPSDRFERYHEAARLATTLHRGGEGVERSVRLARLIALLERTLRFRTTGTVNDYDVQRARLDLLGRDAAIFVLRDASGMIRLALFADGGILYSRRSAARDAWQRSESEDPAEVASLLRRTGYLTTGADLSLAEGEVQTVEALFRTPSPQGRAKPVPGERTLSGVRASPGRVMGIARMGTAGRNPADLAGAILLAPTIRPEDNAFIHRAAGIVSTGGGILSHAGLLALQFRKPALIVEGRWDDGARASPSLAYRSIEFREVEGIADGFPITMRQDVREREDRLREGDLLVLDVEAGTLSILGQEPDALALYEAFRLVVGAATLLAQARDEGEILRLRGLRLRARHQIERLLTRLRDPSLARHAARELLLGEIAAGGPAGLAGDLLPLLLANPVVGAPTAGSVSELLRQLDDRCRAMIDEARTRIPTSEDVHEILALRLQALQADRRLEEARAIGKASGVPAPPASAGTAGWLDAIARARLAILRDQLAAAIATRPGTDRDRLRHELRRLAQLDELLGSPQDARATFALLRDAIARDDRETVDRMSRRRILGPADGGIEMRESIGSKAANLVEIERLAGAGLVPPWFVITDAAFREVMEAPHGSDPDSPTTRALVDAILAQGNAADAQKSFLIRKVWESAPLPGGLAEEIRTAYARLAASVSRDPGEDAGNPPVAVRSSGREEDTELASRAGEFETFLFVRGSDAVLDHVKRVWGGLWTERAIHNRALFGQGPAETGGGVLVQRICRSRVSGVLQTVNVGEGRLQEVVINAGLGLGEGIVSGTVGADMVVVSKEGAMEEGALRFRYVTNDKREKVVFDSRAGMGTTRVETLSHERFRPALEYVEICELARAALTLEAAYGYPLDIEFGIEGTRLEILQARPVTTFASVLRETEERHPLPSAGATGPRAAERKDER